VAATSNCFLKSALGNPIPDSGVTSGGLSPPSANGAVDTTQPFTVVTQFITSDGTDGGALVEIRRSFVQNGVHIPHPAATNIPGNWSSISDAFCKAKAAAFGDNDNFEQYGGLARMGQVMDGGMVLVLSQW
jgi:cellulose 1,4-beta-cellobiosidase